MTKFNTDTSVYYTEDGDYRQEARILAVSNDERRPLVALVTGSDGVERPMSFALDGSEDCDDNFPRLMVCGPQVTQYVNILEDGTWGKPCSHFPHGPRGAAKRLAVLRMVLEVSPDKLPTILASEVMKAPSCTPEDDDPLGHA